MPEQPPTATAYVPPPHPCAAAACASLLTAPPTDGPRAATWNVKVTDFGLVKTIMRDMSQIASFQACIRPPPPTTTHTHRSKPALALLLLGFSP